jgi:outer membrane protein assembly factor BamB
MAGCTLGSSVPVGLPAPAEPSVREVVWRNREFAPVSQPVRVGDLVLVYGTRPQGGLDLYALDPTSGRTIWQRDAAPGRSPAWTRLTVAARGQRVAYLSPAGPGREQIVVADARTGQELVATDPAVYYGPLVPCGAGQWCATTLPQQPRVGAAVPGSLFTVSPVTAEITDTQIPAPGLRMLGRGGLLEPGSRTPEVIGRIDGPTQWVTPLADAFPPRSTSDSGWDWEFFAPQGLFVGSYAPPVTVTGPDPATARASRDLGAAVTVALDAATGRVTWRQPGAFACFGVLDLPREASDAGSPGWPVRCRATGSVVNDGAGVRFIGLELTVEGFDVATGATTWSLPLGPDDGEMLLGLAPVTSAGEYLLTPDGGAVAIDPATGRQRAPAAGETFWCSVPAPLTWPAGAPGSTPAGELSSGLINYACTAERAPAAPPGVPHLIGARFDDIAVVSDGPELTGYRVTC